MRIFNNFMELAGNTLLVRLNNKEYRSKLNSKLYQEGL